MTIGYVARRLVEAYGRDAARDKALVKAYRRGEQYRNAQDAWVGRTQDFADPFTDMKRRDRQRAFWRSVARACTRVSAPSLSGATK